MSVHSYIKFHFVKFSDADTVLKTLADTLKGVTVSGQYDAEDFCKCFTLAHLDQNSLLRLQ